MSTPELRYGPIWIVDTNRGREEIVPKDKVPDPPTAADLLAQVDYDPHAPREDAEGADQFVYDWQDGGSGWFGRGSPDAPWRPFDSAEQGMASLGLDTFTVQADEVVGVDHATRGTA